MIASVVLGFRINNPKLSKLACALYLLVAWFQVAQHEVLSFGTISLAVKRRMHRSTTTTAAILLSESPTIGPTNGVSSVRVSSRLPAKLSEEENPEDTEQWDREESLLVMNLSPMPGVSVEDSLSSISRYVRSFPFAAVLPVQPLQALPTDDGGLELRFLRKKTATKSGMDGGVRFFVRLLDDEDEAIEVLLKRNSEGQSIPKIFAEKLIVQSFAKGMALGSDRGNEENGENAGAVVKVPVTRIESPTKDMATIKGIFHKWM
mmetsp:Transcript_103629/g.211474  ORF Transcript_103629/g.211474 Transcript_103629/m.211474 type:complete len:262 (-) Transcript_103629:381-1166(-)